MTPFWRGVAATSGLFLAALAAREDAWVLAIVGLFITAYWIWAEVTA